MAFKEVVDLDCDRTTALGGVNKATGKKNPTKVEGYFIGSKDTPSKKSRNGIAKLHIIQTAEGNLGVWGKTDLDRKMASTPAGAMVRITQNGTVPTPNGDMYKFKVEVDLDNTIEVNFGNNTAATSEGAEGEPEPAEEPAFEASEEETEEEEYVAPARPVAPARAAVPADAARRAKVAALLGGKK